MLRRFNRFRLLPSKDRALLLQALLLLPIIHARLKIFGFKRTLAALIPSGDKSVFPAAPLDSSQPRLTAHLVHLAAKYGLVHGNCLSRALTLWALLRRQGLKAEVRIGVRKAEGAFLAHAWVEWLGQPLDARGDVRLIYTPFEKLELPKLVHWA